MNRHAYRQTSTFSQTPVLERYRLYGGNVLTPYEIAPYEIAPDAIAGLREALDTHPAKVSTYDQALAQAVEDNICMDCFNDPYTCADHCAECENTLTEAEHGFEECTACSYRLYK